MKLHDVENLSAAELKERRAEITAAIAGEPELAERYVQARLDAKLRDEKLAEQGRTITLLQESHERLSVTGNEREKVLAALQAQLENVAAERDSLREQLAQQAARADRLKAEAERNFAALTTAEKAVKDALAQREIDAADKG